MRQNGRRTFDRKGRCVGPLQPVRPGLHIDAAECWPRKGPSVAVQADETGLCCALRLYSSILPVASASDRKNRRRTLALHMPAGTCDRGPSLGGKVTALRSTATAHDSRCSLVHHLGTKPLKQPRYDVHCSAFGLRPRS
jgi:hypothetical protein